MTKYEDREWIIRKELQAPGEVGDVITFGMYPTYEEAMDVFIDLYAMGLKVWIERNTVASINPLLDQSIDVLEISTKTKNNLKYYGFNTIGDLYKVDIWKNPKFEMFSNKLKSKILSEIQRYYRK